MLLSNKLSRGQQAADAAVWVGSARIMSQVLRLIVGAILAHLLTPAEFGLVAMALVFSGFLSIFSDAGLRSSVIQFQDLDQKELSSVFWLSVILGGACVGILIAVSPIIAAFSRMPQVGSVVAVMSFGLLFAAVGAVPVGLLQRNMMFRKTAAIEIIGELIAGLVAVALALSGAQVWALVAQALVAQGLTTLLYFVAVQWYPSFNMNRGVVRRVFLFSGNIMAFNAGNYWARNLDSLMIGRFFGEVPLGYYNRAYSLMMYPYSMLQSVLSPVIHSVFAGMQSDVVRLRVAYLRTIKLIMVLSFPITIMTVMLANSLVQTLWGSQWSPSVPIFRVLCIVSAIQPVYAISGNIYLACNRTDLYFKLGLVYVVIICIGMIAGLPIGVMGIAIGYTLANILVIPPILCFILVRLLNGSYMDLLQQLKTPVLMSMGLAVVMVVWNALALEHISPLIHLLVGCILAAGTFLAMLYWLDRPFMKDIYSLVPDALRRTFRRCAKAMMLRHV